jgi:four helix bundle protein
MWERITCDLMARTERFPKSIRFTLSARIEEAALDVLEGLAEARFASGRRKADLLSRADGALARLRVLVRLAHARGVLDHGGYEHVSRELTEAGRMLGGWRRERSSTPG